MDKLKSKKIFIAFFLSIVSSGCGSKDMNNRKEQREKESIMPAKHIKIILGTTREQSMSSKIGLAFKKIADIKSTISTEIIDLANYALPFLYEATAPAKRTVITDPAIQRWSDAILAADGFIFIVPEYNGGYPGALKNALDLLYTEWSNKPALFVGHSGGPSGGKNALNQLEAVILSLKMIPISPKVLIPSSWKALNPDGTLAEKEQELIFDKAFDGLIKKLI